MSLPAPIQPGTVVGGDFRVVAPLAAGGMGALYVAEQLSIGKQRALKVMHPSLVADPTLRERFVQEARVGAMVPSDHVVEVVGAGIDPVLGVPWLAMELLNGEDLARHVARRGPLGPAELPGILRPLCHALGAAHSHGIVHRDVKPENVFLASTKSSTHPVVVKILDFGIAKVAAQAHGQSTAAMGTPMWMAPEQTELRSHVSPATDVWPLGLIAFWLLTGQPYWRAGQSSVGGSVPQLMREILFEPLDPPSERARELGCNVPIPAGFDQWFLRCLERDPARRFQNASEAANALFGEVLGTGAQISLPPPPDPSAPSWPVHTLPSGNAPGPGSQAATLAAASTSVLLPKPVARGGLLGPVLLVGGVVVVLVLALGAVGLRYFFFSQGSEPTPARSAQYASTPSATAPDPVPIPSASASPTPRATTPKGVSTRSEAAPSAAPSASAPSPASKGPYDSAAAITAVQSKATWAQTACKHPEGPAALSGSAVFAPPGNVQMVILSPKDGASTRGGCVRAIILGARIKAYDGTQTHSVPFAVSF